MDRAVIAVVLASVACGVRAPAPIDVAAAARQRRTAIAAMLDDVERTLPALPHVPGTTPPWALWHDPGAQAAYVGAEVIAERLRKDLGPNPPRGLFSRALNTERDRIDRRTQI